MWFIKLILFIVLAWGGYWLFSHMRPPQSPLPASSPLVAIPEVEQDYYLKIFDYAMDTLAPNGTYPWHSYSASGNIAAQAKFTSKWKATCRTYAESILIGKVQSADQGIACKRKGAEGWCHLKAGDAETCAMEPPTGIMDSLQRSVGEGMESGKGILGRFEGQWR